MRVLAIILAIGLFFTCAQAQFMNHFYCANNAATCCSPPASPRGTSSTQACGSGRYNSYDDIRRIWTTVGPRQSPNTQAGACCARSNWVGCYHQVSTTNPFPGGVRRYWATLSGTLVVVRNCDDL